MEEKGTWELMSAKASTDALSQGPNQLRMYLCTWTLPTLSRV